MDLSFGARLRLQRERRHVALSAIAAETKINLSLLEALERDDLSRWPEGIFRRGYVRAYAQAIGLEPGPVVRELVELFPDSIDMPPPGLATQPNPTEPSVSGESPTRLGRMITSAFAAVPAVQHPQRREPAGATVIAAALDSPGAGEPVRPEPDAAAVAQDDAIDDEPHRPTPGGSTADGDGRVESEPLRPEPSLAAAAHLCTRLGQVLDRREVPPLLEDAAKILDAVGLILWCWDPHASALRPSLAHGYSDAVLARLPGVRRDEDNATAAAFRSAEPCVVNGGDGVTGAVVVPLMATRGCVGVLALELRYGGEERESVRALATILAAQLVTLIGSGPLAEAVSA